MVAGSSSGPGAGLSAVLWSPTGAHRYAVRALGSLPDWEWSTASGLNRRGVVVGTAAGASAGERAVAWVPTLLGRYWTVDLGTLPGGGRSGAAAVNDSDAVVGGSTSNGVDELHATLWLLPRHE
jgi:hypothetical protein